METTVPFKILLADDDTDDLQYMKFLFKNHKGFEVLDCLTSGKEVLENITRFPEPPHILLIDMYMPLITGADVARTLLEAGTYPGMAIFIISTTINKMEEEKFSGRVHFLQKPLTLVQINDFPEMILERMNAGNINRI